MLRKIVVINSKVYGKAEVRLDDCNSLQLVGPNNIGKSTLIYALNFLFIVDGNKMTFSGQRRGDKETIHHYFPTPNQSYIVFEMFKDGPYCILVKRDSEGELEYFKFDAEYDEKHFFDTEEAARLLKFNEVREKFSEAGIALYQFKNKSEVFNQVYQRGRKNNAVVWLEDNVKSDGLSNNFSKVYRYLINSKLITNKTLKESLIIADNRENEGINFSQKNKKDIIDLLRINDEIKNVKSVRHEFMEFREMLNQYKARTRAVAEYLYAFNRAYKPVMDNLDARVTEKAREAQNLQVELSEVLVPKRDELMQKIGEKTAESDYLIRELQKIKSDLEEIDAFDSLEFLQQSMVNLDQERREIEARITTIENTKVSAQAMETRVEKLRAQTASIEKQIQNNNNLLIHTISKDDKVKQMLNAVLSEQVLSLPESAVKKKITKVSKALAVFDGEIELPKDFKVKETKSVEFLEQELVELQTELKEQEALMKVALDFQHARQELDKTLALIESIKVKLRKISEKPVLNGALTDVNARIHKNRGELDELKKELNALKEEIQKKEVTFRNSNDDRRGLENRRETLKSQKLEIETIGLEPIPFDTNEGLEQVYQKVHFLQNERTKLKFDKDRLFEQLKYKVHSTLADEEEFVNFVEEEIACLNDKESSIEGLLQSISTQFANPAYTLIKRYEDFKEFIYEKFNQKLSKTRISDIESLRIELVDNRRILEELKKISQIENFQGQLMLEFDQSENLKILNQYLDNGKRIHFAELFDIELHLQIKGQQKKVDLADQVESDGTDRMIRLVIVMSIINRLAINDKDNRITLFIDEVATIDKNNRPELVKFCKEHNFIPIFAAPEAVPDFNKYYFIFPSKSKIHLGHHNVAWQYERN